MRITPTNLLTITLEDEEIDIFSDLIWKIKNTPQKIGFAKNTLTEEEKNVIDALCETFGHKDNTDAVNVFADKDTVK